jgi:hypothetical protein
MWQLIGAAIDFFHALAMVVWVLGLPLLFVRRWPGLTKTYGVYAISFIVLNLGSQYLLDECFLTTLARMAWQKSSSPVDPSEWFTVRASKAIFHLTPPHQLISRLSEVLIFVTAVGALISIHRHRQERARPEIAKPRKG